MILVAKCWKTKNDKLVKALFYENEKGRFLLTFDKWALISFLGSYKKYKSLAEGDEIFGDVYIAEPLPDFDIGEIGGDK